MRWARISDITRSVFWLSVFFCLALSSFARRNWALHQRPRAFSVLGATDLIVFVFSSIENYDCRIPLRRQLAFDKLGFDKHADSAFVVSLPFYGPYLGGPAKRK